MQYMLPFIKACRLIDTEVLLCRIPDEVPDKGEVNLGISAHWLHPVQADQGSNLEFIILIPSCFARTEVLSLSVPFC
jgi:hypothetical protein